MSGVVSIVCVKWGSWCAPHGARYVNNLFAGISRHLDLEFRFICFTDDATGLNPEIEVRTLPRNLSGWWWNAVYAKQRSSWVRRLLALPYRFVRLKDDDRGLEEDRFKSWQPIDLRGWYNKLYLFKPGVLTGNCVFVDLDTVIVGNLNELFSYEGELCVLRDLDHQLHYGSGLLAFRAEAVGCIWDEFVRRGCPIMEEGDQELIEVAFPDADFFQDRCPGQVVSYKLHCRKNGVPPYARVICFHGPPRPHEIEDPFVLANFDGKAPKMSVPDTSR